MASQIESEINLFYRIRVGLKHFSHFGLRYQLDSDNDVDGRYRPSLVSTKEK